MPTKPVVLALSGHDPSGAAGVQADIEALAHNGCHCISVITSLTAQNTAEFRSMTPQEPARFREQLDLLTGDITVDACKIGLIGSIELIETIGDYLASARFPVVLDPVLGAGAGADLSTPGLVRAMTECLLPHTGVITPNLEEAQALTGCSETEQALHGLLDLGCETALITAADQAGDRVINTWISATREIHSYRWDRLPGSYHGSGCTLSACLAGRLALGDPVLAAVKKAQEYTWQTLKNAHRLGKSQLHPGRLTRMSHQVMR